MKSSQSTVFCYVVTGPICFGSDVIINKTRERFFLTVQLGAIGACFSYAIYTIATMNFPFSVYYILSKEMEWNNWVSFLVLFVMKPLLLLECFGELFILLVAFSFLFSIMFWTKKTW